MIQPVFSCGYGGTKKNNTTGWLMHYPFLKNLGASIPEHIQPTAAKPVNLKSSIDRANLTEMWDMILTLDYGVSEVDELSPEKQDEFLNVMSLLLKAFNR